jgi:acetyltransferase-like isoleucine patch superfamily enzyme
MSRRDPRQARFLTLASLRWVFRNRAWSWWYLVRYWRFFWFKVRNPHVITTGFVFLGRRVELHARRGYAQLILGRWVHIGDENRVRCHEGVLTIGDKVVLGRDNTFNCYLDIEVGDSTIIADWVYICDFDHVTEDLHVPIKDQGIVKSPVRIGPDTWVGVKASVLRGAFIGRGTVVAAHAVVRDGTYPDHAILGGTPARVLKDRNTVYLEQAATREALADIARKHERAAQRARALDDAEGTRHAV